MRRKFSVGTVITCVLGVALLQPVVRSQVYSFWRAPNNEDGIDSILVLGTAQYDGRPSRQFAARLRHTADLWRQHESQRVFTVGGKLPGDRYTEADVAREFLINEGVNPHLIFASAAGNDTATSYERLAAQDVGRVLIVTDPNHSYRAVRIARQRGFKAKPSPTRFSPAKFPHKSFFLTLLHEWGGVVVLDVSALLGRGVADKVEDILRSIQAWMRPSRRARHEQLRRLKD